MQKNISIDLNADLGEGFGAYQYGADEALLPLVTSANIACGWHGGDPATMRRAVALAVKNGVHIGAHPGYPDRMGFGRRNMDLSRQEVEDGILYQLGALEGICKAEGTHITYVKPHGALYNAAARNEELAKAVVTAVKAYSPTLTLLCPAGSAMAKAAQEVGLSVAREFFADRGYRLDGSLVPRKEPGAVIEDPEAVCNRVLKAVVEGVVVTNTGEELAISFDSICLHGDNPSAVALAQKIRAALENAGISLQAFTEV